MLRHAIAAEYQPKERVLRILTVLFVMAITLSACGRPSLDVVRDPDLVRLATWMSGTFSSAQQASTNEAYFDIHLGMRRIWPHRRDGIWLYVEQAATKARDKPYRQRVYRLLRVRGSLFESQMFSIPNPQDAIGKYEDPNWFRTLDPSQLTSLTGCSVVLRRMPDGTFSGSTLASQCVNTREGAAYATSEVRITRDAIRSWDRGFSAEREYRWGAKRGPYIFKKHTSFDL